jgi:hypothetical protein
MLIIPSSWGFQLGGYLPASSIFSGAVAGEKRRFLQGKSRTHNLYFVIYFALFYFCLHHFIENTQKIVSL